MRFLPKTENEIMQYNIVKVTQFSKGYIPPPAWELIVSFLLFRYPKMSVISNYFLPLYRNILPENAVSFPITNERAKHLIMHECKWLDFTYIVKAYIEPTDKCLVYSISYKFTACDGIWSKLFERKTYITVRDFCDDLDVNEDVEWRYGILTEEIVAQISEILLYACMGPETRHSDILNLSALQKYHDSEYRVYPRTDGPSDYSRFALRFPAVFGPLMSNIRYHCATEPTGFKENSSLALFFGDCYCDFVNSVLSLRRACRYTDADAAVTSIMMAFDSDDDDEED